VNNTLTGQLNQPTIARSDIPIPVQEILSKKANNIPMNALEKLKFEFWKEKRQAELGIEGENEMIKRVYQDNI